MLTAFHTLVVVVSLCVFLFIYFIKKFLAWFHLPKAGTVVVALHQNAWHDVSKAIIINIAKLRFYKEMTKEETQEKKDMNGSSSSSRISARWIEYTFFPSRLRRMSWWLW